MWPVREEASSHGYFSSSGVTHRERALLSFKVSIISSSFLLHKRRHKPDTQVYAKRVSPKSQRHRLEFNRWNYARLPSPWRYSLIWENTRGWNIRCIRKPLSVLHQTFSFSSFKVDSCFSDWLQWFISRYKHHDVRSPHGQTPFDRRGQ